MRRKYWIGAALLATSPVFAQEIPKGSIELKAPAKAAPVPAERRAPIALEPQPTDFVPGPGSKYQALVHTLYGRWALLGMAIEPEREGMLVQRGFRRVTSPKQVDHQTLYNGRVYTLLEAKDEALFQYVKAGDTIQCESRKNYAGAMIIVDVRR